MNMDILRLALEIKEKESDRYWNRSNIMLVLQGALVAAFSAVHTVHFLAIAISGIGLLMCFLWLGMLYKGKCYISRWDYAAKQAEQKLWKMAVKKGDVFPPVLHYVECSRKKESKPRFFLFRHSTTILMMWAVVIMMQFWLFIGAWMVISTVSTKNMLQQSKMSNESTLMKVTCTHFIRLKIQEIQMHDEANMFPEVMDIQAHDTNCQ
jgi:hypothetical protein